MPPRKAVKKSEPSEIDLESLFAAQDSSSDDSVVMAFVEKQMQAAAEKKRKARDAKLLQAFKIEANKIVTICAEEVQSSLMALSEELDSLTMTEAENEDKIRAIWTEIGRLRSAHSDAMDEYAGWVQRHEEQRVVSCTTALDHIEAAYKDAEKLASELYTTVAL